MSAIGGAAAGPASRIQTSPLFVPCCKLLFISATGHLYLSLLLCDLPAIPRYTRSIAALSSADLSVSRFGITCIVLLFM